MRIGVVPVHDRSWGGMYQYSVSLIRALDELDIAEHVVVFAPAGSQVTEDVRGERFDVVALPEFRRLSAVRRALARTLPPSALRWLARIAHLFRGGGASGGRAALLADVSAWQEWFASFELDLLVFTVESDIAFVSGVPYVVSIHDLQHRLQPHLPEYSEESDWERREYRMRRCVAGAAVVLVDSETSKEDVLACYGETGIDPDAIMPLPSAPAHYLSEAPTEAECDAVREKYGLPDGYLFYPAQFWPHKNHRRLVEALGMLARDGVRPHLVLAGTRSGRLRTRTFDDVMRAARTFGVEDQVHYLGYVPDEEMAAVYSQATALTMPTLFGPTNIPVVEAWRFDLPVLTSDLRGVREHVGAAALLFDPESPGSIAEGIRTILSDEALRAELVGHGRARLAMYTHEDYVARVREVLEEAQRRAGVTQPTHQGESR